MDATLSGETTAQAPKQTTKKYKSPPHALIWFFRKSRDLWEEPDPNGLQVLKCRVSVRRHVCHPSCFQGRGCENGRSTEDPASES